MLIILHFLSWTLLLYWIHRASHRLLWVKRYHLDHHGFILDKLKKNQTPTKWHWNNLFLYNDTKKSTIDLWITEVLPTFAYSYITGQWWIMIFYYLWAALIQETLEHNTKIDVPLLTSGRWHLLHHTNTNTNYGLFFPIWDKIFGTYQRVQSS